MKTVKHSTGILLTLVAIVFLGGCAQSPIGVFESIQLERRIVDDRDLENELSVAAVARAADRYFISAASLWHRSVTDTAYPDDVAQWMQVPFSGTSNHTTSSLVAFAGSGENLVYAVYASQDASDAGVYAVDPAQPPTEIGAGARVFGTEVPDVVGLGQVFVAGGDTETRILVTVLRAGTSAYTGYERSSVASSSFVEVDGRATNLPVVDVATGAAGEVFFLTRKSLLVDGDGINANNPAAPVTGDLVTDERQPEFGGLYFDSVTGILWVTDNEGYLYRSDDEGATWTHNATAHTVSTSNEDPLEFTDIVAVSDGTDHVLVVGTNGNGYRELDADSVPTVPSAEGSNYQASDLAQATILTFHVDPGVTAFVPTSDGNDFESRTGDRVFAGTSNLGLWKALFAGVDPQWVRE
jgi:hypothetical protein